VSEDLLREYITESLSEAGVFSTLAKVTAATGKAWKKGEHVGNLLFQGDLSGALQAFLPDELKDKIAKLSSKEFSQDDLRARRNEFNRTITDLETEVLKRRDKLKTIDSADVEARAMIELQISQLSDAISALNDQKKALVVTPSRDLASKLVARIATDIKSRNINSDTSRIRQALDRHYKNLSVTNDKEGFLKALMMPPTSEVRDFYIEVAKTYHGIQKIQIETGDLAGLQAMLSDAVAAARK